MAQLERVKVATVGILALVLGAGFLLGAVWDRKLDAAPAAAVASSDSTAPSTPGQRASRRPPLYFEVKPALDAKQLADADQVVTKRREAVKSLMAEPGVDSLYKQMKAAEKQFKEAYDPRFRALIDTSRAAIRQIMTPEQAAKYDSLLADQDRKRRQQAGG
jgi:hypothetical protein